MNLSIYKENIEIIHLILNQASYNICIKHQKDYFLHWHHKLFDYC